VIIPKYYADVAAFPVPGLQGRAANVPSRSTLKENST